MQLPVAVSTHEVNPMTFTENQHGNFVLDRLRHQRATGRFCDVILVVQERQFSAHRTILAACSPYFDSILKVNKVVKEQVTVNCHHPHTFDLLLRYMYSGSVVIDRDNVLELLKLSNNFLVTKLKNYCAEYLDRYLDVSNALIIKDLAEKYNMPGLLKNCTMFLETNINMVLAQSADATLIHHTLHKLNVLLTDPTYNIEPQVMLRFIVRWVEVRPADRQNQLKDLLKHIKFEFIPRDMLERLLNEQHVFLNNEMCTYTLLQTMYEHAIPLINYEAQYQTLLAKFSGEVNVYFNNAGDAESLPGTSDEAARSLSNASSERGMTPAEMRLHHQQLPVMTNGPHSTAYNYAYNHQQPSPNLSTSMPVGANANANNTPIYLPVSAINIKTEVPDPEEDCTPGPSTSSAAHMGHSSGQQSADPSHNSQSPTLNGPPVNGSVSGDGDEQKRPSLKLTLKLPNILNRKTKLLGQGARPYQRGRRRANGVIKRKPRMSMLNGDETTAGDANSDRKPEIIYRCPHCVYSCNCQSRMQAHIIKAHSRNRVFSCNICDFECKWNREYYTHMKTHFEGPPFMCDSCDYTAERIQMLLTHRMKHSDERPYECSQCEYRCRTKTNLLAHERAHSGEKPFPCPECGRGFAIKSTLDQHLATHSDVRPFQCEDCEFSTKYQSHLISHKRIHTGDVFHCQYEDCNYSSPKKSQLAAHLRTHLAVRAFVCKQCNRSFIEKSHLVRHERIHLTDKPFKCEHCEYASSRRDKLKEHILKHHSSGQPAPPCTFRSYRQRRVRRAKQLASLIAKQQQTGGAKTVLVRHINSTAGLNTGFRPITPAEPAGLQSAAALEGTAVHRIQTLGHFLPSPLLSRPTSSILPAASHGLQPSPALSLNFNYLDCGESALAVNKDVLLTSQVAAPTPVLGNISPLSTPNSLQLDPFGGPQTPTTDLLQRPMSLPPLGAAVPTTTANGWGQQMADFSFNMAM